MPQKIVIIDYGMGNIQSIFRKFSLLGIEPKVTSDPTIILEADKLILPGVGHFGKAMDNIKDLELLDSLNEKVLVQKTPILGICLGMQLMTHGSEEGESTGFGWVDAVVKKISPDADLVYKIPHIGWNTFSTKKESKLLRGVEEDAEFYFVHSFVCKCYEEEDVLSTTSYKENFVSAFEKENIFGVQYHPEKSFENGRTIINNFVHI